MLVTSAGRREEERQTGKLPGAGISNPEVQLGSLGSCLSTVKLLLRELASMSFS